ncbi:MAG: hypothetical protein HYW02_07225 [Deltaproteobacteria bacterium]|nr:hypothetical protein [Deltaproteobacteria bacterium]
MSVLFPLLTLYTLAYFALMLYDFVAKPSFDLPPGLFAVYIAIVLAYATDKEVRRWTGKEMSTKKGTWFVKTGKQGTLYTTLTNSLRPPTASASVRQFFSTSMASIFLSGRAALHAVIRKNNHRILCGDCSCLLR